MVHIMHGLSFLSGFVSSVFKLVPEDLVETVHLVLSTLLQKVQIHVHVCTYMYSRMCMSDYKL